MASDKPVVINGLTRVLSHLGCMYSPAWGRPWSCSISEGPPPTPVWLWADLTEWAFRVLYPWSSNLRSGACLKITGETSQRALSGHPGTEARSRRRGTLSHSWLHFHCQVHRTPSRSPNSPGTGFWGRTRTWQDHDSAVILGSQIPPQERDGTAGTLN